MRHNLEILEAAETLARIRGLEVSVDYKAMDAGVSVVQTVSERFPRPVGVSKTRLVTTITITQEID